MKKPNKSAVKPARLTIILENYAGITKQEWVGTPQAFAIDWPVQIGTLLGERMTTWNVNPSSISFSATIGCPGACYRSNHEVKE